MKKSAMFIIATTLFSLFILVAAYSQEEMTIVDNSIFETPQREPSVFVHDEHNDSAGLEECSECHHLYDDDGQKIEDESSEDQQCSECHEENASDNKPALTKAFHTNCKGCHLQEKKGPIMCGECHVKR